ncbi:MAG: DUF3307 domain-containing protein [Gemmatimonadetes bacterium]|nr:DUF3307 domain-containing protein [Gemmatimonadota bacterium]
MTLQAVWLLAGLLAAHCVGDFSPLATARMLEAKANGGPMTSIAGHAAVHAALVGIVVALLAGPALSALAVAAGLVFVTHFGLDASRALLGRRYRVLNDTRERAFWYALGLDQLGHGLVLVGVAAFIL